MILLFLRSYQIALGPLLGGGCRFTPTCSTYAIEAFQKHSLSKAAHLTATRLLKCHPLGPFGHDPLPEGVNHGR